MKRIDGVSTTLGSVGFALAVLLAIGGAVSHRTDTLLGGACVALLVAVTLISIELISHKGVTHAQTAEVEVVAETVPPHP